MKECPKCESCYPDEVSTCPQDQTATKLSLPGTQLLASRYLLTKRLGRGAMGQVYLANDNKFAARKVAVKTVLGHTLERRPSGKARRSLASNARQAAASIQHPNTVSVTDYGESEDGVFFAWRWNTSKVRRSTGCSAARELCP